MNPVRVARYGAAAAGAGMAGSGGYAAVAWARYGHVDPHCHPRDELLDRFLPEPKVDEYHQVRVRAPAAVTFAAAKQMDIQASPIIKGIFWLRAIPALLRGEPFRPQGSQGIVAETLGQGWGVLAEAAGRSSSGPTPSPGTNTWSSARSLRKSSLRSAGRDTSRSCGRWRPAGRAGRVAVRHPHPRGRHRPAIPHEVPPVLGADIGRDHPDPLRRPAPGQKGSRTAGVPARRAACRVIGFIWPLIAMVFVGYAGRIQPGHRPADSSGIGRAGVTRAMRSGNEGEMRTPSILLGRLPCHESRTARTGGSRIQPAQVSPKRSEAARSHGIEVLGPLPTRPSAPWCGKALSARSPQVRPVIPLVFPRFARRQGARGRDGRADGVAGGGGADATCMAVCA